MNSKERLLDRLFQELSNGKLCQCCGAMANCSHHLIRRRNKLTRWQPINALYVCTSCHSKIHNGLLDDNRFITPQLRDISSLNYKDFILANDMTDEDFQDFMIKLYKS